MTNVTLEELIGRRLKKLREDNGFSLNHVSNKTGIHTKTLSNYENCVRAPSYSALLRLKAMYNIEWDYFDISDELEEIQAIYNEQKEDVFTDRKQKQAKLIENRIDTLKKRLKERREALDLEPSEVAEGCKMPVEKYKAYEDDPNKGVPNTKTLYNFSAMLECTPEYLVGLTDDVYGTSSLMEQPQELLDMAEQSYTMFNGIRLAPADLDRIEKTIKYIYLDKIKKKMKEEQKQKSATSK